MVVDRTGLGFLGFIFGGLTAVVMFVAVAIVMQHADGQLAPEGPSEGPSAITVARQ